MGMNITVKSPQTGETISAYCKWKDVNPDGHPIFVVKQNRDASDNHSIIDFGLMDSRLEFEELPELDFSELDPVKDAEAIQTLQDERDAILKDRDEQTEALRAKMETEYKIYMDKVKTAAYECQKQFDYILNGEVKTPLDFVPVLEVKEIIPTKE